MSGSRQRRSGAVPFAHLPDRRERTRLSVGIGQTVGLSVPSHRDRGRRTGEGERGERAGGRARGQRTGGRQRAGGRGREGRQRGRQGDARGVCPPSSPPLKVTKTLL